MRLPRSGAGSAMRLTGGGEVFYEAASVLTVFVLLGLGGLLLAGVRGLFR